MARRRRRGGSRKTNHPARALLLVLIVLAAYGGWWLWEHRSHQAPSPAPEPPAQISSESLRIATWNLRQFSGSTSRDWRGIVEIINQSQFDLLAIQEVKGAGEAIDQLLNLLGPPWRGSSLSPLTGNSERFAFLYRSDRVQEVGRPHLLTGAGVTVFDRTPYVGSFRAGQFDFALVSVHLSYTDTARRRREAEALSRFARDIANQGPEHDVIVLGDFNEQRGNLANLAYFDSMSWKRLITEPTNLSGRDIFDNLLIDPKYSREWSGRSGVVRFDETRFGNDDPSAREAISDHRPAWADFVTVGPDDD